ncbi:LexA/Signal peptidase [Nemania sp. FL0031]|nr:LexA/Signal peptidase [Nemania sp. FL0031]
MPFLGHPFRLLLATAQSAAAAHVLWVYGVSFTPGLGPSMLPTIEIYNDWFVTDKRYRRGRGVRVGDCVVFSIPIFPGEEGVKRVTGMPGDYVLRNTPPATSSGSPSSGAVRGAGSETMIQVPKGHCFVVGDNLHWSRDSRDYGPIPLALIKGKVIAKGPSLSWNPMNWFTRLEGGLQTPDDVLDPSLPPRDPS